MHTRPSLLRSIDWWLLLPLIPIMGAGLLTMSSFGGGPGVTSFFGKQLMWILVSLSIFVALSRIDTRFFKDTRVLVTLFLISIVFLLALFPLGSVVNGSKSWFSFGAFSFQPADITKLVLVLVLAKYFSRRHVEIGHWRHILISGTYALIPFFLIFLQPDFGSALVIFLIWFGMVLVSGLSKRHLALVGAIGAVAIAGLWFFVFESYQKDRIETFFHPLTDIEGSGYNAFQSTIAVGSGQVFGKGIGYGTQSRLQFLPEYETDFIFAAFSEEWGFVGAVAILLLYAVLIARILSLSIRGASNFEMLFGLGLAIYFMSHIIVNVGMNIGLMPVTGIPLPFMSYGGSHLLVEFMGLGILSGMQRYTRAAHRDDLGREFIGAVKPLG